MGMVREMAALMRAGYVLAREGVISALPGDALPPPARIGHRLAGWIARRQVKDRAQSERLSRALNRLGPSWVKLGQFLATRPDVVGKEIARDLELLHDQIDPFPLAAAKQSVSASLGRPVEEMFDEISEPVAAASVAQVHRARIASSGDEVALKVIRPGVRRRFERDLSTFYFAARLQERFIEAAKRLRPVAVVDMLAQSAHMEMDLRLEAAALSEMAENTQDDPGFRVPGVDWELTGRDCLTIHWIDGIKLNDVAALQKAGHDIDLIAANLVQSFLRHTLRDGFFHADMHPGNLFVEPDGTIAAVDLGITGRLGKKERRFLAEILYGFIRRDYQRVAEVHFEAGYVPSDRDVTEFARALRAVGEPIFGMDASKMSMGGILSYLFEVTERFGMETRTELILLQRTMVVVEGVARSLNPQINIWQVARPVVENYIRKNVGPRAALRDLSRTLAVLSRYGPRLPQIVESALVRQSQQPHPPPRPSRLVYAAWAIAGFAAGAATVIATVELL